MADIEAARAALAGTGVLRAAINLGNVLLVTGRAENGDPEGVSPDMAAALAERLSVGLELVPFESPGGAADAVAENAWDIVNIAADPKRAETIAFAPAYVEIEATYLVPAGSAIQTIGEVDRPGVRIAVSGRSAYDLWLSRNLQRAELVRGEGLPGAVARFRDEGLDMLAGLRPALREDAEAFPGARVLEGRYMAVQQAIGCRPGAPEAVAFLTDFVRDATANGLVQTLLEKHGVQDKLQVARG